MLDLFDEAIAWLVARGQNDQWGSEPYSQHPAGVEQVRRFTEGGGLRIAERDAEPVGALVIGSAPAYVPRVDVPELYIQLLLSSRRHAGEQIGARLIQRAIAEALKDDCLLVRVDCWAGAPALVGWYESQGFSRSESFQLNGWPGQIFAMPVPPS